MITFSNAKINLGLHVIEKRNDGYHNIETVFYPVPLSDMVEIIEKKDQQEEFRFSSSGLNPGCPVEDNLCYKAWYMLQGDFATGKTALHVHKKVPSGAGLGGGSSNAAFTLKMLNQVYRLGMDESRLLYYAGKLGSDCPFFIKNEPCFAEKRGEKMSLLPVSLSGKYLVLLHPGVFLSTKEAYAGVRPRRPSHSLRQIAGSPPEQWKDWITNDFETHAFSRYPVIRQFKEELYRAGALFALMSGSGSAVYGIFPGAPILPDLLSGYLIWQGPLR